MVDVVALEGCTESPAHALNALGAALLGGGGPRKVQLPAAVGRQVASLRLASPLSPLGRTSATSAASASRALVRSGPPARETEARPRSASLCSGSPRRCRTRRTTARSRAARSGERELRGERPGRRCPRAWPSGRTRSRLPAAPRAGRSAWARAPRVVGVESQPGRGWGSRGTLTGQTREGLRALRRRVGRTRHRWLGVANEDRPHGEESGRKQVGWRAHRVC